MKAQTAIEYYTIVGIGLIILLPLSVYVYGLLNNYGDDTKLSLARDAVNKLGESADWVFSQGPPAKLTLEVYIPEGVQNTDLNNNMILLQVKTSSGVTDIYYTTICPLIGSIPTESGHHTFSIIANLTYVNITVV
jgi:hypothetical protein